MTLFLKAWSKHTQNL